MRDALGSPAINTSTCKLDTYAGHSRWEHFWEHAMTRLGDHGERLVSQDCLFRGHDASGSMAIPQGGDPLGSQGPAPARFPERQWCPIRSRYGSEDWGFESLRARQMALSRAFLLVRGEIDNGTDRCEGLTDTDAVVLYVSRNAQSLVVAPRRPSTNSAARSWTRSAFRS
jgi:hypothetical protein